MADINSTTGHESEVIDVQGLKASLQKLKDSHIDTKVADVAYDSQTGKIQKTIDGKTTDICNVVTSGFKMEYSSSTGIKSLTPVGGAVGVFDNSTGIKAITF